MSFELQPIHPTFAAELRGVDAGGTLADDVVERLREAIDTYAVLVLRDQALDDAAQATFARRFGPLEESVGRALGGRSRLSVPGMVDISNLADANGTVKAKDDAGRIMSLSNQLWHSDSSFRPVPGALSMLYAHKVPGSGGNTEFCDLRAAYDALDDETRAMIADLEVVHDYAHSRALLGVETSASGREALPSVVHPLVSIHPGSGRRSLFIGAHADYIAGWPVAEGRLLLAELTETATQPSHLYAHVWRQGDLVIWDNRCTLHRGRRFDERQVRDLRRVTTRSEGPPRRFAAA